MKPLGAPGGAGMTGIHSDIDMGYCGNCHGEGKCPDCRGTGDCRKRPLLVDHSDCDCKDLGGTKTGAGFCTTCNGTGDCPDCDGTGDCYDDD